MKKRLLSLLLSLVMLVGMLPASVLAASWQPTDTITIKVRVYDLSTYTATEIGTDTVTKGDQYIQSDNYQIPSLDKFLTGAYQGYTYGRVRKVVGNWYFPSGDLQVGANVQFSCNSSTATITYWVDHFSKGSGSGSGSDSGSSGNGETFGDSGKYTWQQTIVYHSNYPNGTDNTYSVTYTINAWSQLFTINSTNLKSPSDCGFTTPSGYTLNEKGWNTSANGSGTWYNWAGNLLDGNGVFQFDKSDAGKTTNLYAQYDLNGAPADKFWTITYMDGSTTVGTDYVLKGESTFARGLSDTTDKTFAGWTNEQGTAVKYEPGATITPTGDMTLYAVWHDKVLPPTGGSDEPEWNDIKNGFLDADPKFNIICETSTTHSETLAIKNLNTAVYSVERKADTLGNYYFELTLNNPSARYPDGHVKGSGTDEPLTVYAKRNDDGTGYVYDSHLGGNYYCKCEAVPIDEPPTWDEVKENLPNTSIIIQCEDDSDHNTSKSVSKVPVDDLTAVLKQTKDGKYYFEVSIKDSAKSKYYPVNHMKGDTADVTAMWYVQQNTNGEWEFYSGGVVRACTLYCKHAPVPKWEDVKNSLCSVGIAVWCESENKAYDSVDLKTVINDNAYTVALKGDENKYWFEISVNDLTRYCPEKHAVSLKNEQVPTKYYVKWDNATEQYVNYTSVGGKLYYTCPIWKDEWKADAKWDVKCTSENSTVIKTVSGSDVAAGDYTVSASGKNGTTGEWWFKLYLSNASEYYPDGHSAVTDKTTYADSAATVYVKLDDDGNYVLSSHKSSQNGVVWCRCDLPIYVYAKTVDSKGNTIVLNGADRAANGNLKYNWNRWLTLGTLTSDQTLDKAKYSESDAVFTKLVNELATEKFDHQENTALALSKVDFYEMNRVSSKNHSSSLFQKDSSYWAYHLDGKVTFYAIIFDDGVDDDSVTGMPADNYGNGIYSYNLIESARTVPAGTVPEREGYNFLGWEISAIDDNGKPIVASSLVKEDLPWNADPDRDYTFTAKWEKKSYTVSVDVTNGTAKYTLNGVQKPVPASGEITVEYGDKLHISFFATDSSYALDTVTVDDSAAVLNKNKYDFGTVKAGHDIKVVYAKDEHGTTNPDKGDGIPDKYQAKVTFQVEHGTWDANGETTLVKWYNLYEKKSGEWKLIEGVTLGTLPTATADTNYDQATFSWRTEGLTANTPVTGNAEYKAYFQGVKVSYTIKYVNQDGVEIRDAYVETDSEYVRYGIALGYLATGPAIAGYTFDKVLPAENEFTEGDATWYRLYLDTTDNVITYYYTVDPIDVDLNDPDGNSATNDAAVWKELSVRGGGFRKATFTVTLTDGNRTITGTVEMNAAGKKAFHFTDKLTFTKAGTYTFTVKELKGRTSYMTYDKNSYKLKITVTEDPAKGGLYVSAVTPVTVKNSYRYVSASAPYDGVPRLNKESHFNYVMGYSDGTIRPNNEITRAEVAIIFFRLLTDECRDYYYSEHNAFTDVADTAKSNIAISTLTKAGILTGYSDGTFRPNAKVTRGQLAAIIARFADMKGSVNKSFSDINDYWAKDLILLAASNGWIDGYSDGTFRPTANITRAQAMKIINLALDRNVTSEADLLSGMNVWIDNMDPNAWYYYHVQEATNNHTYIRKHSGSIDEKWTAKLTDIDWTVYQF